MDDHPWAMFVQFWYQRYAAKYPGYDIENELFTKAQELRPLNSDGSHASCYSLRFHWDIVELEENTPDPWIILTVDGATYSENFHIYGGTDDATHLWHDELKRLAVRIQELES